MANIEHRIAALADDLAMRPQNDALTSRLEPLMAQLADKAQQIQDSRDGNNAALANIEYRISELAGELAHRAQDDGALSARFEALLEQLSVKIEQIQLSRDDHSVAFSQLEDRIAHLMQRLDTSDSHHGNLDPIERGLAELMSHVEDIRANNGTLHADTMQGAYDLKTDIARAQDAIEGLHATLGLVVDRLATIEHNVRGQPRAEFETDFTALRQAIDKLTNQPDGDAAPPHMPVESRPPIDPDLAADQPLEPGSGGPLRGGPPSFEAPPVEAGDRPAPAGTPGSKSSFIAAARRAAQAAGQESTGRAPKAKKAAAAPGETKSIIVKLFRRMKSLFVAASVVAIVLGGAQIVGQMLDRSDPAIPNRKGASLSDVDNGQAAKSVASVADDAAQPPLSPATEAIARKPLQELNATANALPSIFSAPMLGDVTGSISHATPKTAPPSNDASSGLPEAIGGVRLRSAAAAGDAAAAYEIGSRFAEARGVPANPAEAAQWFARAAAKGLAPAQFRYASMLEKGRGVKKDVAQARQLYLAAANKGNAKAMHNLAVLYAEGIDGKPDYANAAHWFQKAANAGISDSQFNLGVLAARGMGVEKNLAESYKWFALAAARGDKDAVKKRDSVAAELDAKTLAAAKKATASFVAKPEPAEAIKVPTPPGGWDHASSAPPPKAKSHPASPLSPAGFTIGKR